MFMRVLIAGALVAASLSSAFADTITAKVKAWDPEAKILTLDSDEEFPVDPAKVEVPAELKAGDTVTIEYSSTEDGVTGVFSITIDG